MPSRGAILLCGSARQTVAAIARELAQLDAPLLIQAGDDERAAGDRLCRLLARSPASVRVLRARLGGDADARRLAARAWKRAPALATVVLCAPAPAAARAASPTLAQWRDGIAGGLRAPFFVAKHAGLRLAERGGRLIVVTAAPRQGAGPLAAVVHEGLLCMIEALAKALPRRVAVNAVIGRAGSNAAHAAETARAARWFAEAEVVVSGATIDLAGAVARG